jgi:hypothetical protein
MIIATLRVIVCLFFIQSASAQVPITPKPLTPSSIRNVLVPPFNSMGNPACDADGDMYFHVGRSFNDTEILRLSADGNEGKLFKLSDQFPDAGKFRLSDFSVAPSGTVYVLGGVSVKQKSMLLRFDEGGKPSEPIPLRIPADVIGDSIMATDNRMVLLFGYHDDNAPPDLKGKSYLALLDTSGAVRQELHISVPGADIAKLASGEASSPGVALGDDGNFYLAGSNQILVISQGGELVGRIPFDNPYPKSTPARLQVSGGVIVVTLARIDGHDAYDSYLVLLNPSGGVVGYYEPSKEQGNWVNMCYSPKQGLTFLKVENEQVKLLTAPFR